MRLRGPHHARSRARRTTRHDHSHCGSSPRFSPSDWLLHQPLPFHWASSRCLLDYPRRTSDGHYERIMAHDAQRQCYQSQSVLDVSGFLLKLCRHACLRKQGVWGMVLVDGDVFPCPMPTGIEPSFVSNGSRLLRIVNLTNADTSSSRSP